MTTQPDHDWTAGRVMAALAAVATGVDESQRHHYAPGEQVLGVRMRHLFDLAKAAAQRISPEELDRLFADPTYEGRMTAFSILDFQARRRLGDPALRDTYLRQHDAITSWGMVDRAAPRVVGASVAGGPYGVLRDLAGSPDALRRRTAMTAPLWFIKHPTDADLAEGFGLAGALHADAQPVVSNAVGIWLAYAGEHQPHRLDAFLERYGAAMARPAHRLAHRKRR